MRRKDGSAFWFHAVFITLAVVMLWLYFGPDRDEWADDEKMVILSVAVFSLFVTLTPILSDFMRRHDREMEREEFYARISRLGSALHEDETYETLKGDPSLGAAFTEGYLMRLYSVLAEDKSPEGEVLRSFAKTLECAVHEAAAPARERLRKEEWERLGPEFFQRPYRPL